ncbi:MAG TPA: sugar phosphate nucleotidyltransferase [Pyrinomonadaceae bacterium]
MRDRWAVILAGGDGTRLRSMTRAISGDNRPKQFVPVIGGSTLLNQTRRRVALSIEPDRTLIVVTQKHRRFYKGSVRPDFLVEQPVNKGTAPAILYALLRVAAKSPQAVVALFPSDHFFADDEQFMSHVDVALDAVEIQPETVLLLGITPTAPETEYGWIEPHASILSHAQKSITRVKKFWEKPAAYVANMLLERGCLWNSFVMVGTAAGLLKLTRAAMPELYSAFEATVPTLETANEPHALAELYAHIDESNFSHEVLAARPEDLMVMRVADVGWSDLGEPNRVLSALARLGVESQFAMSAS